MKWPWHRAQDAEHKADAAEQRLRDAHDEHAQVRELADTSREILHANGFANAIRTAMGVKKP